MLRSHWYQPNFRLVRWIAKAEALSSKSHGDVWLPTFQFDLANGAIRLESCHVLSALMSASHGLHDRHDQ